MRVFIKAMCTYCKVEYQKVLDSESNISVACERCGSIIYSSSKIDGEVYILSNRSIPGKVKIGSTGRSTEERIQELNSSTGVPEPFVIEAKFFSKRPEYEERLVHQKLTEKRQNKSREFFDISPTEAIREIESILGRAASYSLPERLEEIARVKIEEERILLKQEQEEKEKIQREELERTREREVQERRERLKREEQQRKEKQAQKVRAMELRAEKTFEALTKNSEERAKRENNLKAKKNEKEERIRKQVSQWRQKPESKLTIQRKQKYLSEIGIITEDEGMGQAFLSLRCRICGKKFYSKYPKDYRTMCPYCLSESAYID